MGSGGLSNHVAMVTGGGGGIGRAVCERLAADGAIIVVADIDHQAAYAVATALEDSDFPAVPLDLDVASRESWNAALARLPEGFSKIDILVNVAGVTRDRSIRKMTDDDWKSVIDINLYGTWLGCQIGFQEMAGRGGRIVNFASTAMFGAFGQSNYSAAKAGVAGLTRTAAIEGGRHGILVNAVAPGFVETEMTKAVPQGIKDGWLKSTALGRPAAPAEIAAVVAFLVSADASFITGQTIVVDGGASSA